jgi:hypothetical protein
MATTEQSDIRQKARKSTKKRDLGYDHRPCIVQLLGEVIYFCKYFLLYYSVFKSSQPERNSKTIGIVASREFSDSRKPIADSPGLPDLRSPTSDFPADSGFRLLASGLFGCGSAAL